jgi:uncharacterized protein
MLIVLDTNVLVSALLKRESKPAAILNAILENQIELAVDQRILEEYREVLHRPKLNIRSDVADSILRFIAFSALWVQTHPIEFPQDLINDSEDLPFLENFVSQPAETSCPFPASIRAAVLASLRSKMCSSLMVRK